MPSTPTDRLGPLAPSIDLAEDLGLRYWRNELQCSAEQLLAAVESVGTDACDVAEFLAVAR